MLAFSHQWQWEQIKPTGEDFPAGSRIFLNQHFWAFWGEGGRQGREMGSCTHSQLGALPMGRGVLHGQAPLQQHH